MRRHVWKCLGVIGTVYQIQRRSDCTTVLAKTSDPISVFDLTNLKLEVDTLYQNYEISPLYLKMEEVKDVAELGSTYSIN